ncbi:hypothetical protein DQ04_09251030 [Trypanosoma grayi]|uniref:hypothetical protein n=1 Tax=Trypanosoma grayi TaxID=71804 RepID=UPI0004F4BC3B|nr:hypothetical protein DQ04_09251030 [Trypanosoma grayi]KEG07624.1 hypothetical protein DQ04_09251030 [Trypanosoma grayi]
MRRNCRPVTGRRRSRTQPPPPLSEDDMRRRVMSAALSQWELPLQLKHQHQQSSAAEEDAVEAKVLFTPSRTPQPKKPTEETSISQLGFSPVSFVTAAAVDDGDADDTPPCTSSKMYELQNA